MKLQRILAVAALLVALCAPVAAQDYALVFDPAAERIAGMRVNVWDPDGETCTSSGIPGVPDTCTDGAYVTMTLETLLDGLVEFDDGETRYLALIDGPSNLTQPTCSTSVFTGSEGKSFEGQLAPVSFPPTAFVDAWICVAVPADVDLTYFTIGQVNSRNQLTNILEEQGPITVTTADDYVAWVGRRRQVGGILAHGWYAFFSPNAVAPQP